MKNMSHNHEALKEYYGRVLSGTGDLKTNACCSEPNTMPLPARDILKLIDQEITDRFYGCGSPIPASLDGCTVLDLGCGTGRDTYILSGLVGKNGLVIGIDMTDEQLSVARRYLPSMMEKLGFQQAPNVEFRSGYIEKLQCLGIESESVDVVVSNCVINLSPYKREVFKEIFRVLKPGGELLFSDVFSGQRIPESLKDDPVLLGECLSGALYIEDFRRLLNELGCSDYRLLSKAPVTINNPEIEAKIGGIAFYSMTIRAFKLDNLEDICEDYGQIAAYKGTVSGYPHSFQLDDHHRFITGKPERVCGNTAAMLQDTRLGTHFTIQGTRKVHYGPFDCASGCDDREPAGTCC
ncbi:methyltransferase domain-containing protein [Endozoicomonas montiporae]|nr:methyltransferase domain-containing protein [Endozoicomonas montiporae]AMO58447.1 type 11 methyltransferase [Endozoicomonas montiporae CL-33]